MKTTTLVTAAFATLSCYSELVTAGSTDNHVLLISPQRFEEQDWQHQGCYVDVGRTINDATSADGGMTNAKCTAFCFERGFVYAGTEYFSECYCGHFLAPEATHAKDEDCGTECAGNSTEACGGRDRLTLYKTGKITPPAVNPGVDDWESMGCYIEGSTGRALERQIFKIPSSDMTAAQCMSACDVEGYALSGVEYGGECFCGHDIQHYARPAALGGCGMTCNGNRTEFCGGSRRINLYQNRLRYAPHPTLSAPTLASTAGSGDTTTPTQCPNRPATVGQGLWNFHGCYTEGDNGARALDGRSYSDNEMTLDDCALFCGGFAYFGLEYGRECYCGNAFKGGAVETLESECSMLCPGGLLCDYCGAGNRLSVYLDSRINVDPSFSPVTTTHSTYTTTRISLHISSASPSSILPSVSPTLSSVYSSTGFESRTNIESSPSVSNSNPASSATSVSSSHTTDTAVSSRLVISTSGWSSTKSATRISIATVPTRNLTTVPSISPSWNATHTRLLPPAPSFSCASVLSSIETITDPSTQPPELPTRTYTGSSSSSTPIYVVTATDTGTSTETRHSTYTAAVTASPIKSPSRGGDTGSSTSSRLLDHPAATSPTSSVPSNSRPATSFLSSAASSATLLTNSTTFATHFTSSLSVHSSITTSVTTISTSTTSLLPDGWELYGCWIDGAHGRILDTQLPDSDNLTLHSCASSCAKAGYTVAGTEFHSQCFCDNHINNGGSKSNSEAECNTPCTGNSTQICGGGNRMTIMSVGLPSVRAAPVALPEVGSWKYQGCYEDNVNQKRTFFWQNFFPKVMTPKMCLDRCADFGYMAAGLEYGQECYCGDPQNIIVQNSKKRDEKECKIPCVGDTSVLCGGGSRMSTYFWEGKPFYTWDFPAAGSPAAGSYDFLIGGTNIPLITSQAVNGKVTFLEKFGTGPPNSTGAYELDLSEIANWNKAWRTMHVKTDIFCAAGLTLPDKAGRQINIGGWSGASTFGVRLYSPDGKAGVHGKNDWEENASILKLQDGRWYPTAMNMANGSVLIIGGEKGSNSAPVPTLEILPATGTKPLRMDWLERTDPNNLYPFAAVLPSGGIFVAYWNEARILDENTFATVKTLPIIPGAVNDPRGGRTYPLEGTAVLLPQYAPYTDPLGVLICGGSTIGPGNALDNCVSTYPDAESPQWALERMPSTRVMSCMAPLPDGTFLILNGAHHGVAGFGLGVGPNLNALLYDPKKPLGGRITVMANTTVARLYHSEGITLLDGRVLVTGSDPQDGVNPQEYRIETFTPPYLLSGKPRPTFTVQNTDWSYGQKVSVELGGPAANGDISVSLLGSVSSTHGNSMGARTLFPEVSCAGTSCTVTAPPGKYIAPPGWYQFFVLDGGIPAVGVFVRIGGDPASLGNWPPIGNFTRPGV